MENKAHLTEKGLNTIIDIRLNMNRSRIDNITLIDDNN
jgi:hypothetical protein